MEVPRFRVFARSVATAAEPAVSTTSGTLLLDQARESMDVLAGFLDAFVTAWEASKAPPDLQAFLPETGEIRRLTLVELIKVDLEYRWLNRGCPKRLADYLAEFPELGRERVPSDLIYEEFHIRKQSGQDVSPEEYLQAFPAQAAEIASLLGMEQKYESSSFHKNSKQRRLAEVRSGETIEDFDLLVELGSGAFAKVFLARQRSMERLVALKVATDRGANANTRPARPRPHRSRLRPADRSRTQAASALHAVRRRGNTAGGDPPRAANTPAGANRQAALGGHR